ncbi:MAG: protein-glutamate O-methyltransferase CheR [Nitrospinae bacterium]|nr:protein-glutamate O-methyltransferase CheR [Nitrospinota bacterium]
MKQVHLSDSEFSLLAQLIDREMGIFLEKDKKYFVETKLKPLLHEMGLHSFLDLYHKAASAPGHHLAQAMAEALTTNETSWFRDGGPYKALEKEIFPKTARTVHDHRRGKIRVWSAACSTGQEPYSIAMAFLESLDGGHITDHVGLEITATDISKDALAAAQKGRYDQLAIERGMPKDRLEKYFSPDGKEYELSGDVKKLVHFKHFNLKKSLHELGMFDIIFLRNVAIYFSAEFKKDLMARTAGALRQEGYLFLGSSESAAGYKNLFALHHGHGAIYYQKI